MANIESLTAYPIGHMVPARDRPWPRQAPRFCHGKRSDGETCGTRLSESNKGRLCYACFAKLPVEVAYARVGEYQRSRESRALAPSTDPELARRANTPEKRARVAAAVDAWISAHRGERFEVRDIVRVSGEHPSAIYGYLRVLASRGEVAKVGRVHHLDVGKGWIIVWQSTPMPVQ